MTKKVYRSAQGKNIDIGALQLQNETVRAVGNMGVNARGDHVNAQNKTVDKRSSRIGKQYKKQVSNVSDDFVPESKNDDQLKQQRKQQKREEKIQQPANPVVEEQLIFDDQVKVEPEQTEIVVAETEAEPEAQDKKPASGLADAIARARTVKKEALKTPRQQAQEKKGVKRI